MLKTKNTAVDYLIFSRPNVPRAKITKKKLVKKQMQSSLPMALLNYYPLKKNDKIVIRESKYQIRFIEIEKHYSLKSIHEKFAFK